MTNDVLSRRLAVIVAADVVGYSRLMEADESGTLAQLKSIRKELIDPKIAEHRGTRPRPLIRIITAEEADAHALLITELGPQALWLAVRAA